MLESIFKDGMTVESYFIGLFAALVCGIISALCASIKGRATKSLLVSLILLPMIVETVITMVNGNVGTGVAVMGAFSLVRFRSVPGKAREIAALFLSMTAGLACAAGFVYIALIFSAVVGIIMVLLAFIPLGEQRQMDLRITVPESLHFVDEFEDIFEKYTKAHRLTKTRTTNMGSLYKLNYKIILKDVGLVREFIDELRCRNGNLEIALSEPEEGVEEL